MPPSLLGRLQWLARSISTKSSKKPQQLPKASSWNSGKQTRKPALEYPKDQQSPKPSTSASKQPSSFSQRLWHFRDNFQRKPRIFFSHRLWHIREAYRAHFTSQFRDNVRRARWALAWVPIFLVFDRHVLSVIKVSGPSMVPTLNGDWKDDEPNTEDLVLINLLSPGRTLSRGDVVAFRSPQDPEKIVIKRVMGLQGDLVYPLPPYPPEPLLVPWGQMWVEGDNEDKSKTKDSNWYGPIPRALVIGKVFAVVWPFNHIKNIDARGWKHNARIFGKAVAIRHPDELDAEEVAYWRARKKEADRQRAATAGADMIEVEIA